MTACVKNHSKRVALAISASLVGALSLGAAAPAFAADIEMQFVEGGSDDGAAEFANGDVALAFDTDYDGFDDSLTTGTNEDGDMTVSADKIPFAVTATSIKPAGTVHGEDVTPGNDYKIALYRADEEKNPTGSPLSGNRVTEAGAYVLTVTPLSGSDYIGQTFKKYFEITPVQIKVDGIWEDFATSDNYFRYTGSPINVEFEMGGKLLVEGVDYTVKYTKIEDYTGLTTTVKGDGKTYDEIVDAGKYVATLTGLGKYEGTTFRTQTTGAIDVAPYNLTNLPGQHIVIDPFLAIGDMPEHPSRVWWDDGVDEQDGPLDPSLLNIAESTSSISASGRYDVNVYVDEAALASANVVDSRTDKTETIVKMDAEAQLQYRGQAVQDSYDVFIGDGSTFNPADFRAVNGSTALAAGSVEVTGTVNTAVAGTYEITVTYNMDVANNGSGAGKAETSADPAVNGKVFAASKTITVRVWKGSINADTQLYVYGPEYTLDGKVGVAITSYDKPYDGSALEAGHFCVVNEDRTVSNNTNVVNPANLTATLYKADGTKVDKAVDAGEYYLEITSNEYKLTGTTRLPITIHPVDLSTARIGRIVKWNDVAGDEYLPLGTYICSSNGLAIQNLGLVYDTGNGDDAYNADQGGTWHDFKGWDLIPDNVDVTVEFNDEGTWKPVARVDKAGQFRAILTVGEDVASNYGLPEGEDSVTLEFTVAEKSVFSDVQPSDWFYGSVLKAYDNHYVHGDSGATTFRPNATITRGEVAVILYNMSGVDDNYSQNENNSGYYQDGRGWITGFDDVDGNQFYAKAISWAKRAGVVNGYDGTNDFRPDAPVTSEEFAAMLSNYAEKVNQDDSVAEADPSSLEGVPGGSEVSGWAQKAVAWAVENEVMGNNGANIDAHASIIRARVAAMCVNYQPNEKSAN